MKILGICNATDSGAALIVDGRVVSAVNEERFVRKKQFRGFPEESIRYVLASENLTPSDIDWVGCGAWGGIDETHTLPRLAEDISDQLTHPQRDTREIIRARVRATTKNDHFAKTELVDNVCRLGVPRERILCCDHHYSHGLTAYYGSAFDEAIVLTADARGDFRSVTLWSARRDGRFELLDLATELNSPGALYGFVTKLLGFVPDRHEGKVTGLAAHGEMTEAYELLASGFFYDHETKRLRSRIGARYRPFMTATIHELTEDLRPFRREDIAFAAQKLLEDSLSSFLMSHIADRPDRSVDLCLAGGCMGNVKLNFELSKLRPVRDIYVFPQMGDGGNALGGALHVARSKFDVHSIELEDVYLGPAYSNATIEERLTHHRLRFERLSGREKSDRTAKLLAQGKIVGWFQGRMEYGPRALGGRSILAEATSASITEVLNTRLSRSEFMPFAPATTAESAPLCFEGWKAEQRSSRFMTTCYRCTPAFRRRCPAVVHVDNTARPQVVFRDDNPEYYDVIDAYTRRTTNPALINTSFNHHEEPIVCTPDDAIRSFSRGNVDVLVIGDFVVERGS